MADSVRFCKQIPLGLYNRFAAYATAAGMTERDALITILDRNLRHDASDYHATDNRSAPAKADQTRMLNEYRKRLKPYDEKYSAGTITFEERDARYDLIEKISTIKHDMGTEPRLPEEIMREHYWRELDNLASNYEYDTILYEAGNLTEKGAANYHKAGERIITLKDRLK